MCGVRPFNPSWSACPTSCSPHVGQQRGSTNTGVWGQQSTSLKKTTALLTKKETRGHDSSACGTKYPQSEEVGFLPLFTFLLWPNTDLSVIGVLSCGSLLPCPVTRCENIEVSGI